MSSENATRSEPESPLPRDFSLSLAARVVPLFSALIVQALLARWLQPDLRGSLASALALGAAALILFLPSPAATLTRLAAQRTPTRATLRAAMLMLAASSVLALLTASLLSIVHPRFGTTTSIVLAVLVAAVTGAGTLLLQCYYALGKFRAHLTISMWREALRVVLVVLGAITLSPSPTSALVLLLVSAAGVSLLAGADLLRTTSFTGSGDALGREMRAQAHFVFKHHGSTIGSRIFYQAPILLGSAVLSAESVGFFAPSLLIAQKLELVPDALSVSVFRRFARGEMSASFAFKASGVLLLLFSPVLVVTALFAPIIVRLLFSEAFLPGADILPLLVLGAMVRAAAKPLDTFLAATGSPGLSSLAAAPALVVMGIAFATGVVPDGSTGLAISFVIGCACQAGLLFVFALWLSRHRASRAHDAKAAARLEIKPE